MTNCTNPSISPEGCFTKAANAIQPIPDSLEAIISIVSERDYLWNPTIELLNVACFYSMLQRFSFFNNPKFFGMTDDAILQLYVHLYENNGTTRIEGSFEERLEAAKAASFKPQAGCAVSK